MALDPTWQEIREAGEAAGLAMDLWEDALHDRLIAYIVDRTKSAERYHTDAAFHAQIERLIGLVIGCLTEHSPLVDPLLRAQVGKLDDLFRQGAGEGRPDA